MEARPEVALPAADGVGEQVEPAGKVSGDAPPPVRPPPSKLSVLSTEGDHILSCPNCDTLEYGDGVLLKTTWAIRANPVNGL